MSTERLNLNPALLRHIVDAGLWGPEDFYLIDVGASGGIERHWSVFGDRLRATAFEPLVAEAERLQQQATGSKVTYEAAFVTCRDFDQLFPPDLRNDRIRSRNNDPFQRVSAVRAQELMRMNYTEHVFNAGAPAVYTERRVLLDEFIPASEHPSVDFIKIDTDGHDFEVLLGADALLRAGGALGMSIEAQFHGAAHDHANTFANIDRFMRGHGFSLFDLEVYRYSRAALPAPFVYDIPAQTTGGQVLWGEAVYFRDLATADYEQMWPYLVTRTQVLKLAALFELFGLPDCAAELLQNRRSVVGDDCDALLDLLVSDTGIAGSYRDYLNAFDRDPKSLYRSRRIASNEAAVLQPPDTPASSAERAAMLGEVERLNRRVTSLKSKAAELIERVKRRDEKIEDLTRRLDASAERRRR